MINSLESNRGDYDHIVETLLFRWKCEVGFFVLWGIAEMIENNDNKENKPMGERRTSNETQSKYRKLSIDVLKQILKEHKKWLKSKGKVGKRADLHLINLKKINMKKAILAFADMQQSNLFGVNLQQANLIRTNLKKSYLSQANLKKANLSRANLESAKLTGSNLRNSNLTKTNLKNSDCKGADFEGAILEKVTLQGADLMSTFLEEADLRGADLTGAKNLTITQLSGAKTLYQAQLDPELMEKVKKSYPHLLGKPKEETDQTK
jgi:uncharacterized protein YjbI with pentapeptide repeats